MRSRGWCTKSSNKKATCMGKCIYTVENEQYVAIKICGSASNLETTFQLKARSETDDNHHLPFPAYFLYTEAFTFPKE
jgi:hypothetical protein